MIDAAAHGAIARTIGSEIAVLLKNEEQILPLSPQIADLVIIGQAGLLPTTPVWVASALSKVTPLYTVTPLAGLRDVLADLGATARVSKVTVADDLSKLDEAKRAAAEASVVVLMAGLIATEGADQPDANMLNDQNTMLDQLLGLNPSTVRWCSRTATRS